MSGKKKGGTFQAGAGNKRKPCIGETGISLKLSRYSRPVGRQFKDVTTHNRRFKESELALVEQKARASRLIILCGGPGNGLPTFTCIGK